MALRNDKIEPAAFRGFHYFAAKANEDAAPQDSGVFELLIRDEVVYIGYSSTNISAELQRCLTGTRGPELTTATGYRSSLTRHAHRHQLDMLAEFRRRHGGVNPTYNDGVIDAHVEEPTSISDWFSRRRRDPAARLRALQRGTTR